MYRLKVRYRNQWKLSRFEYSSLQEAKDCQQRLASKGVQSKLCDSTGKEVSE